MLIRDERKGDYASVFAVNADAFDTLAEAKLVDRLREIARPLISLVAEKEGRVVGHIMFSPVTLSGHPGLELMGLAPMAVAPEQQRRGIGSALIMAGIECCRHQGCKAIVVLGHPDYYPRFGFVPSSGFGIDSEYEAPDEAFMLLELEPGSMSGKSGTASYHAIFGNL